MPVFIFLAFPPQSEILTAPVTIQNTAYMGLPNLWHATFLGFKLSSITGMICISGIIVAFGYVVLLFVFGKRLALRRFHVVMMEKEDYPTVQQQVTVIAQKLRIAKPAIGLVDDLVPNAFTTGYGKNATIVFSLGLLEMLDFEELTAVIAHELSHIKSKDYLLKTLFNGLNILSFFNPFAYLANTNAKKERELMADKKGAALLGNPDIMANVLIKIESIITQLPKPRLADQFSASLFLVAPLAHRSGVLASHPRLTQRVLNLHTVKYKSKQPRLIFLTVLLLLVILLASTVSAYSTVMVQHNLPLVEKNQVLNGIDVGQFLSGNTTYVPSDTYYSDTTINNEMLLCSSNILKYDNSTTPDVKHSETP